MMGERSKVVESFDTLFGVALRDTPKDGCEGALVETVKSRMFSHKPPLLLKRRHQPKNEQFQESDHSQLRRAVFSLRTLP